jgi:hypothetical protein
MALTASTIMLPLSYYVAEAQNKIDPIVLRSAQSYCLEKGLSIVSEEFSTCLSDRIHTLSSPVAVSEPESHPMPAPVGAPTPTIASEASTAPDTISPSYEDEVLEKRVAREEPKITKYPESILFGENDPDYNALGHAISKKDLKIYTIPEGYTAIIYYNRNGKLGNKGGYRRMICETPCIVQIPSANEFKISFIGGPGNADKLKLVTPLPQWKRNLIYGFKLDPDVMLFKLDTRKNPSR